MVKVNILRVGIVCIAGILIVVGTIFFYFKSEVITDQTIPSSIHPKTPTYHPLPSPTPDVTEKFDLNKIKVGDKVGTMTVTKISGSKASPSETDNYSVRFSGRATLHGSFNNFKEGMLNGNVCMGQIERVNNPVKIPMEIQDTRYPWFCFTNPQVAKKVLFTDGEDIIQKTVVINNYTTTYAPTEVFNTADFIAVVEN